MCGRFNVTADPLSKLLMELVGMPHPGPDNYNTAPTEQVTVLRLNDAGDPELVAMRWWLTPYWSKAMSTKYSMFNAKAETLTKSPAFREPFKKRRCVVPVTGFYEWIRNQSKGVGQPAKLPYFITSADPYRESGVGDAEGDDHEPGVETVAPDMESAIVEPLAGMGGLLIAGLWDRWRNRESGETIESFTIVTTAAHPSMKFIHSRQPVMLSMNDARRWLDPEQPIGTLFDSRLPVQLDAIPVSSYVNNARNKDDRCTEPVGSAAVLHADPLSDSGVPD